MKRSIACFSLCLLFIWPVLIRAQSQVTMSSADMYLAIRKLNVLGSVLYVAAHPDDENTRLITFLSKEKLYRTGYLSLTRGDGGQNLIGDEQGIDLGLIRTQELLSARRVDGGEQFFTRAFDFGYSKNPEETFEKWGRDKILADVVWVIRKFQPDVVVTRFPVTGEGGHGHHTASAILANEAFAAAADPRRFPEQLKYVSVWQVKRVLWNTFNFGGNNTIRDDQFRIDVGAYNPLLGKSYGEIAAESRSQHKSQGFGVPASRGQSFEFFQTTKGDAPANELTDGVNTGWSRVKGGAGIEKMIAGVLSQFDLLHPEKSVKGLVELYKAMEKLPSSVWTEQKLKEVKHLIAQCSGLWMDAYTTDAFAVQTDSVKINIAVNNRLGAAIQWRSLAVDAFDTTLSATLARNVNQTFSKTFFVPLSKPVTQPYWLEKPMEEGTYTVADQQKIGQPDASPAYEARFELTIEGLAINYSLPVRYRFTDPVRGELYQPMVVIPPFSVKPEQELYVLKNGADWKRALQFKSNKTNGHFLLYDENGNAIDAGPFSQKGVIRNWSSLFDIASPVDSTRHAYADANFQFRSAYFYDKTGHPALGQTTIRYDHIPTQTYFTEASNRYVKVDLKTAGKQVGYIPGAGDKVPEALEQMGYEVTILTEKELARNNLDRFDAILTGIRAYNTNEWMGGFYDKLMKYVENGGNLIIQYNTNNFISSIASKIGPYPFSISRNRVTNEAAPVLFLKPEHSVFHFPNTITPDDFKGWIQERSVYDALNWDKKYQPLLTMNDPGEKSDEGSLIVADYGKGKFVYTGLVFFRQLPAGNPGAYRLLANLIGQNQIKPF